MSEQVSTRTDYSEESFALFLIDEYPETVEQYRAHGLVATNNLREYFLESSQEEIEPGWPHPYDYRAKSFGSVMQTFMDEEPELAKRARQIATINRYTIPPQQTGDPEAYYVAKREANRLGWAEVQVFTEVFQRLAPAMEAAGFDPLKACL